MPHADQDVTAAALARIAAAKGRADAATPGPWGSERRAYWERYEVVSASEGGIAYVNDPHATDANFIAHARTDLPLLADIAAAAVRLTMRTVPNGEPWYLATDGRDGWCWACEATGGHRAMPFDHAPGCPALALDAAIRAAGEAGQ